MLEDGAVDDSDDFSKEDPVCIDGVIFYGPMTDREKLVKERFERRQKEKVKTRFLPTLCNKEFSENVLKTSEESKNDINDTSIYESFSIDESKYESFNDSLDERKFLNPNEVNVSKFSPEHINVNRRKFNSKSMLKGSLCDSLEDIHSLVSNVEKLSISEEIENINILEKNNIYDDSLRNDVCLEKNFNPTDQNFDDDSLAILDFEKTFDDSLEEADILSLSNTDNVVILRNGGNAEISIENLAKENAITKNLFETSVEVIYENAGYAENSEGNAEPPKQLSLTADSLSISENMSKDSLDGLPVIPRYLEQNNYKKSLSSSNRDEYETFRNSKYHDNGANMSGNDSKPASEQNLSHNADESSNKQFTNVKINAPNSNDAIVIEDSPIESSKTSTKRKNSVKCVEKDFSSQINNSFCKNDCAKLSSSTTSNIDSIVNDHIDISFENIDKTDIHPNNTICIDDSFILPQNTLVKNELHFVDAQVERNQKFKQENISINNINEAIDINCFMQPTLNIKSEKSSHKEKLPKKSNSNFCIQNSTKLKLEKLEKEIHPHDTICIDDSFDMPQNTSLKTNESYSLEIQQSGSSKNGAENSFSENNCTSNSKLNDSLNNSFAISPPPTLIIKSEKTPSSLKSKRNKFSHGKVSRSNILSPVEHQLRHLEKNNDIKVSHTNDDTSCISDSPMELLRVKAEKKSPSSGIGSKMSGKSPTQETNTDSKLQTQSPVKYKLHHLKKKNEEARVSNSNNTICIDCSPPESLKIKIDKERTSAKGSKAQSPESRNGDASNYKQLTSLQTPKMLNSPLEESSKSSISDNVVKDPKKVIDYFKDALILPKDLPKDSNVKLQLEVVFDENQGVNIISVATVDHCTGNITPSVSKVDSRREISGKANPSPDLCDKNKGIAAININGNIYESSAKSDKIVSKSYSSEISEVKPSAAKNYADKSKTDNIFTDDVQNDSNGHNVQLLEALDLHDASCSFIDNGFLQSRDSIMPLNLCIRNRSPETNNQYFTKMESKENIAFLDKQPITLVDHSKIRRRSSTKASNKTPKQSNWNTDVKKSGSKTNSITKIPVRKIDNLLFTPVHQKVSKDIKTSSSSERIFKNPLVKSNSATDNLTSAKPLETPRKHHFCSVRNSISRVPKSTPRAIPKRFQNIESPIAKYIGKPQTCMPLKVTHRYDGNLILGNTVKSSKLTIKTPNSACKGSPQCSSAGKI